MQYKKQLLTAILGSSLLMAGAQKTPPKPYGAIPSENQLNWQQNNVYAFIHFGLNTFTDKEWGYGDEDPALFNPKDFNADQIVSSIAQGGFKAIILTCKHHDGFCLWPTKTTEHNITKSPFRNGKGDLVKEISDACRKYGLKFGVYLSPWDRNAASYGSPAYVAMYRAQLKELLTNYGDICEIWHDGANGGDGYYAGARERRNIDRSTYYNWPSIWALERKLQPKALIFGDIGADLRWVGNEQGYAGDPCWQTFTPESNIPGKAPSNGTIKSELSTNGTRDGKYWMPAEVDFSIRPGWFWHKKENNKVRSAVDLWNHYFVSAGRGASMLLNVPPDSDGLVYKTDSIQLKIFGTLLKKTFSKNLNKGASAVASNIRGNDKSAYGTKHLFDNDQFSYWATDDNVHQPTLTITLPKAQTFDIIRLKENTKLGQRIDSLEIDAWLGDKWEKISGASSIGSNRLLRLDAKITTRKLRLRVIKSPVSIALSDVSLFNQPEMLQELGTSKVAKGQAEGHIDVKRTGWKVITPRGGQSRATIDGNPSTNWGASAAAKSSELIVDMGKSIKITGFNYLPDQQKLGKGFIDQYSFYISQDGKQWEKCASGEFSNIQANPVLQTVSLQASASARYFKFEAEHTADGKAPVIAEFNITGAE